MKLVQCRVDAVFFVKLNELSLHFLAWIRVIRLIITTCIQLIDVGPYNDMFWGPVIVFLYPFVVSECFFFNFVFMLEVKKAD